jgi:hypothetical protein
MMKNIVSQKTSDGDAEGDAVAYASRRCAN